MGDFNAKIGSTDNYNIKRNVGKFRLGDENAKRELLLQFANDNDLASPNMFKHHKR